MKQSPQPKPHTHQALLRCGGMATMVMYRDVGEFCWLGQIGGEVHSWRWDGRWADEGIHPLDLLNTKELRS